MGKILLIEPQRILQQAISLTLFPDHEVRVEEAIAAESETAWKDYDLLIVDGAALREGGRLGAEAIRALQSASTPALWLEEDESHPVPGRDRLVVVRKPLDRIAFCSAVNEMLCPPGPRPETESASGPAGEAASLKSGAKERPLRSEPADGSEFIDLVDVVEDESAPGQSNKAPKKPE
jgi:DNA-binding response OmpR family regulator